MKRRIALLLSIIVLTQPIVAGQGDTENGWAAWGKNRMKALIWTAAGSAVASPFGIVARNIALDGYKNYISGPILNKATNYLNTYKTVKNVEQFIASPGKWILGAAVLGGIAGRYFYYNYTTEGIRVRAEEFKGKCEKLGIAQQAESVQALYNGLTSGYKLRLAGDNMWNNLLDDITSLEKEGLYIATLMEKITGQSLSFIALQNTIRSYNTCLFSNSAIIKASEKLKVENKQRLNKQEERVLKVKEENVLLEVQERVERIGWGKALLGNAVLKLVFLPSKASLKGIVMTAAAIGGLYGVNKLFNS